LNAVEVGFIVLACTFGGSMFGMALRTALPPSHLASETKDLIKLAMGLVATMTALVLGLLTASAKDSFDSQSKELTDMAANVALLDRALAHYGEETGPSRNLLHSAVAQILHDTWSRGGDNPSQPDPAAAGSGAIYDMILALSPHSDGQKSIQSQALGIAMAIGKTRWLLFEQGTGSVTRPFLTTLVCWLIILFISFGLQAPLNATATTALFVCAFAVSSSVWLILTMYTPFQGLIQISDVPLRTVFLHLGQ
jgi:hypothetical protein